MAVCRFRLQNYGRFLVRVRFAYSYDCGNIIYTGPSGYINPGDAGIMYPDEYGVPNGALAALYTDVMDGCDVLATERFVCASSGEEQVNYSICGNRAVYTVYYDGMTRIGCANVPIGGVNRNCFVPDSTCGCG